MGGKNRLVYYKCISVYIQNLQHISLKKETFCTSRISHIFVKQLSFTGRDSGSVFQQFGRKCYEPVGISKLSSSPGTDLINSTIFYST